MTATGNNILDFLDLQHLTLLPNTAGCFESVAAVRVARMGREILRGLGNAGADWVKLEVLGDSRTLLPDPIETLRATEKLVDEGFQVLCYTSDDPVIAMKLKKAGAVAVMPGRKSDRIRAGHRQSTQSSNHPGTTQRGRSGLPGDRRCRAGNGQRCRDGDGIGRRCRFAQHGHRPVRSSGLYGVGDAPSGRGWSTGPKIRQNQQIEIWIG